MNILMVPTPHDEFGGIGKKAGFRLEESAVPCHVFKDESTRMKLASPNWVGSIVIGSKRG